MAVLSDLERAAVHAALMAELSRQLSTCAGLTKADLRAAVNAADDWAQTNAASYNSALPVAFRTAATARQKALLLEFVIRRRYEVS